jgi:hypothetical protein
VADKFGGARRPSFSERYGFKEKPGGIQYEDLDARARTDVYNGLYREVLNAGYQVIDFEAMWTDHFGLLVNNYTYERLVLNVKKSVLEGEWYEAYDLMEYIAQRANLDEYPRRSTNMIGRLNGILELNRAGYRIVGGEVAAITDATELASIQEALAAPQASPARQHLEKALQLFADRTAPQYANSIKESILAVEAAAREMAGKPNATLGTALDEIGKRAILHPALIAGWKKLYGFTSDSGGIRHADAEGTTQPTQALAQYFLITCSAFVNLMTSGTAEGNS